MLKKLFKRTKLKSCFLEEIDSKIRLLDIWRIMKDWSTETKTPNMYFIDRKKKVLHICTSKPGIYIGQYGKTKEKYFEMLKKLNYEKIIFHECEYIWPNRKGWKYYE